MHLAFPSFETSANVISRTIKKNVFKDGLQIKHKYEIYKWQYFKLLRHFPFSRYFTHYQWYETISKNVYKILIPLHDYVPVTNALGFSSLAERRRVAIETLSTFFSRFCFKQLRILLDPLFTPIIKPVNMYITVPKIKLK